LEGTKLKGSATDVACQFQTKRFEAN